MSRAVAGGGVKALDRVFARVVVAEDRLLFAEDALAGFDVVVEDRARGDEGFVVEAQVRGGKFGIGTERGAVGGLVEFDAVRGG